MSLDRPCHHHPDRPAEAHCQKYDRYLCGACIRCREPKNHCKHRSMCMVWEWQKHGLPPEIKPEEAGAAESQPEDGDAEGSA